MGVLMPHYDVSRQIENRVNVVLRHCRIGKVVEKTKPDYAKGLLDGLRYQPPPAGPSLIWNPAQSGRFVPMTSSADIAPF